MCQNGMNTSQFKMIIEQLDDHIALTRRWTHKLYHQADDNSYIQTAQALKELQGLLDEARAAADEALVRVDKDTQSALGATVTLV